MNFLFKLAKYYQKNAQNSKAYHNRQVLKPIFKEIDGDIICAAKRGKTQVKIYPDYITTFYYEQINMVKQHYIQKGFTIKEIESPVNYGDFIISWADEEEK